MATKKLILLDYPVNSFETITVGDSAGGISSSDNAKKGGALFTNEGADVRWRADGTSPTATTGHTLADGEQLRIYDSKTVRNIRFIQKGETGSTIFVSHMG